MLGQDRQAVRASPPRDPVDPSPLLRVIPVRPWKGRAPTCTKPLSPGAVLSFFQRNKFREEPASKQTPRVVSLDEKP
jgi:hypothetical protein